MGGHQRKDGQGQASIPDTNAKRYQEETEQPPQHQQTNQASQEHHTWDRADSAGWSIQGTTCCLPEAARQWSAPYHWTPQYQRCAPAPSATVLRYCDKYLGQC